ncbi:MAG TPA: SRPBCC family protein [Thermoleophilaceae bacterium]|nr:SRPBCC family protein [Thermoleophilaceae bacterium]
MGAVSKYIRIDAPPQQVYDLWRDPSQFPEFMADVEAVENRGGQKLCAQQPRLAHGSYP